MKRVLYSALWLSFIFVVTTLAFNVLAKWIVVVLAYRVEPLLIPILASAASVAVTQSLAVRRFDVSQRVCRDGVFVVCLAAPAYALVHAVLLHISLSRRAEDDIGSVGLLVWAAFFVVSLVSSYAFYVSFGGRRRTC